MTEFFSAQNMRALVRTQVVRPMRGIFREYGLRFAVVACGIGAAAWAPQQVGITPNHIAQWGTGTASNPIIVNRDNPWLIGFFDWLPGNASHGAGTYSTTYSWTNVSGTLRVFEYRPTDTTARDDWVADFLPNEGDYNYELTTVGNISIRTGNIVPQNLYATYQAHALADAYMVYSSQSTFFKLAGYVYVVPVVVISYYPAPYGPSGWDMRGREQALFDFIPFEGSKLTTLPDDYATAGLHDPEAVEIPPDEIWTVCGIQFQVVRTFFFPTQTYPPPCYGYVSGRNFAEDNYRDQHIAQAMGDGEAALLQGTLQPVFVGYGDLSSCGTFNARSGDADHPTIDINLDVPRATTAHELGHILGLSHYDIPGNLMHSNPTSADTQLESWQCDVARQAAIPRSTRFTTYNGVLHRTGPQMLPPPRVSDPLGYTLQNVCCWSDAQGTSKYYTAAGACLATPGAKIQPQLFCQDCCETSTSPPMASYTRPGACNGTKLALIDCDTVCCNTPGNYMSRFQCMHQYPSGNPVLCN